MVTWDLCQRYIADVKFSPLGSNSVSLPAALPGSLTPGFFRAAPLQPRGVFLSNLGPDSGLVQLTVLLRRLYHITR